MFSHGNGSIKKRHIVLEGSFLMVFKARTSSEPKYKRNLLPGEWKVVLPLVESNNTYYAFDLVSTRPPSAQKG